MRPRSDNDDGNAIFLEAVLFVFGYLILLSDTKQSKSHCFKLRFHIWSAVFAVLMIIITCIMGSFDIIGYFDYLNPYYAKCFFLGVTCEVVRLVLAQICPKWIAAVLFCQTQGLLYVTLPSPMLMNGNDPILR